MRYFSILLFGFCFICFMVNISFSKDLNLLMNDICKKYEPFINKVLLEDYDSFRENLKNDFRVGDANASIILLYEAKENMKKYSSRHKKLENAADAYRASWAISIFIWQNTDDQAAKKLILNTWEDFLEEDLFVPSQICALSENWDRNFLTNKFWSLFKRANDKRIISAICYVISKHGNSIDKEKLMAKRDTVNDGELKQIIQNALNWMKYWESKDYSTPGPAELPPKLVR